VHSQAENLIYTVDMEISTGINNRSRVIKTLNHEQGDRIPYQLDLTADMEEIIRSEMGADYLAAVDNCFALQRNESFTHLDSHRKQDMFGALWLLDQQGDFGIVENCMLPEASLEGYTFPEPDEQLIRKKCEILAGPESRDKFTMYIIGFSLFERAWSLRGMENLLMDMVLNPLFVSALLEKIVEYNLAVVDIVTDYPVDAIFFGDDWGQQKGLIMGPDYWRKFIKPALKTMYSHVKAGNRYLCQHSCGDNSEIFGDLIELGLDMYNTFQPEIYDVEAIKKEFGMDLAFYGGISTQNVLPHGTPEDVRKETRWMMDVMGRNGGYVVAPTHAMPADIPVANVQAFLEAVRNQ
jgi:uroporphyrinogen decarboxylase